MCGNKLYEESSLTLIYKGSLHFKKFKKIMENSRIGLTPPPFFAKIMENFEKYQLFYGLKKLFSIEINCIFFKLWNLHC